MIELNLIREIGRGQGRYEIVAIDGDVVRHPADLGSLRNDSRIKPMNGFPFTIDMPEICQFDDKGNEKTKNILIDSL